MCFYTKIVNVWLAGALGGGSGVALVGCELWVSPEISRFWSQKLHLDYFQILIKNVHNGGKKQE